MQNVHSLIFELHKPHLIPFASSTTHLNRTQTSLDAHLDPKIFAMACCRARPKASVVRQQVVEAPPELEKGSELKVLSFNAFCRPPGIKNKANDWKTERLVYLAKYEMAKYDIVCFQELFGSLSGRRTTFLKACASAGHANYITSPQPSWKFLIDGGLVIVSKYPIVESEWRPFAPGCHSDRLAEKGVLYAKIEISSARNIYVHVFNAHTQSSYNDPVGALSWKIREKQTLAMLDFIQSVRYPPIWMYSNVTSILYFDNATQIAHTDPKRNLFFKQVTAEDSFPVMVMGDLNIDARKEFPENVSSSEYKAFFQQLQAMKSSRGPFDPHPVGYSVLDLLFHFNRNVHPVTFGDATISDTNVITPLETVFTKAHDYGSFQSLDYIFWLIRPSKANDSEEQDVKTVLNATSNGLTPKSSQVAKMFVQGHPFTQLSDHYGAEAIFTVH